MTTQVPYTMNLDALADEMYPQRRGRPILFSGEMVRANNDGLKTETRRVIKPQPTWNGARWVWPIPKTARRPKCSKTCVSASHEWHEYMPPGCCPYGVPGDLLYVRESWQALTHGDYQPVDKPTEFDFRRHYYDMRYRSDCGRFTDSDTRGVRWRPSIHMPKWAARTWLEVLEVKVERVQDITTKAIWAEGVRVPVSEDGNTLWRMSGQNGAGKVPASYLAPGRLHPGQPPVTEDEVARSHFADLWDRINARRSPWSDNPWVWVVKYRKVTA